MCIYGLKNTMPFDVRIERAPGVEDALNAEVCCTNIQVAFED